jgi:K+-transporting ATPase ATPase C chain
MSTLTDSVRRAGAALRLVVVLTIVLGLAYPLLITGLSQAVLTDQADGSLITRNGQVVGSSLLGQAVDGDRWFQPRPSAAGDGYNAAESGGSNLGPNNEDLLALVDERRAEVAKREKVAPDAVPVDAVTASGSGLDPDISPEYAALQVHRVARENELSRDEVLTIVAEATSGRTLGFLGEPRVNVVLMNAALSERAAR